MSWLRPALLVLAVLGCSPSDEEIANGDDPIAALAVPHKSERYTSSYWTQKSIRDKQLYAQAVEYCKDKNDGEHPNCDVVRYVDMIERMSRLPAERPKDFSLMPRSAPRGAPR
jgi:hypothetical protein